MMSFPRSLCATLAIALLASTTANANSVARGKVKSINADNKTFVLVDGADKEVTFALGDEVMYNRAGKESKSDLKPGDTINICYDPGVLTWTAHYILVQEGASKNSELINGKVKGYDADKKELTFTNEGKKDSTYALGKAKVRINMDDSAMEEVKLGDQALLIVDTVDGQSTLRSVMIEREE